MPDTPAPDPLTPEEEAALRREDECPSCREYAIPDAIPRLLATLDAARATVNDTDTPTVPEGWPMIDGKPFNPVVEWSSPDIAPVSSPIPSGSDLTAALDRIVDDARWLQEHSPDYTPDGVATLRDIAREIEKEAAALSASSASSPELDAAWAEAEAALPKGWRLYSVGVNDPGGPWTGIAGVERDEGVNPFLAIGTGPTPAAALRALAAALAAARSLSESSK